MLKNAPRDMSWVCKEAQKRLVRAAEAVAFHVTFVSGPDKGFTAPADQDFPSSTCCHSCIRVFVLTGIFLRVKIRSHQRIITRPSPFCHLYSTVKVSLTFSPSFVMETVFFY